MPFTFSHPALVLPFTKSKWFSATGLIIGSMTPDAEYYIRMEDKRLLTHTWHGLFWYDILLGITIAFIFHDVVRDPLINNLPYAYQARLNRFKNFNWNSYFKKNWLIVIISLFMGGVTHFFIDGFCKENGYFALKIPALTHHYSIVGFDAEGWMILQIATSVTGLITLYVVLINMSFNKNANVNYHISTYWIIVVVITVVIYLIKISFTENYKPTNLIIPFISGFLIALLFAPVIQKILLKLKEY